MAKIEGVFEHIIPSEMVADMTTNTHPTNQNIPPYQISEEILAILNEPVDQNDRTAHFYAEIGAKKVGQAFWRIRGRIIKTLLRTYENEKPS